MGITKEQVEKMEVCKMQFQTAIHTLLEVTKTLFDTLQEENRNGSLGREK